MRLMNLEFVAASSAQKVVHIHQSPTFRVVKHDNSSLCGVMIAFVLLCDCFRDDLVYGLMSSGPLAHGIAPDFTRNSVRAMRSEGSYGKLKARKMGPLEILEKINANAYRLALPPRVHTADVFNVKHLLKFEPDDALGFVDESFKGEGSDAA